MLSAPRYNAQGEKVGEVQLDPAIFEVPANASLLHQVVMIQQGNSRGSISHTKTRGEVRGGGKKPWKQKGTGRARHGSIRSPIWRGGGITFGPRSQRNYERSLPVQMKRKALLMALSDKAESARISVVEVPSLAAPKTKVVASLVKKIASQTPTLLIFGQNNIHLVRSVKNVPTITPIAAQSLNVIDVLKHRSLVALDGALEVIAQTFVRVKKSTTAPVAAKTPVSKPTSKKA